MSKYAVLSLSLMLFFVSCKTEEPTVVQKTEPVFRTYKGKARIVSMAPSKNNTGEDDDSYMALYFDFIPSDPGAMKKYQFPEIKDTKVLLNYDNRKSFHKNWIMKWGVKAGNEYPALRYEAFGKATGAHVYYDVELAPSR